MIAILLPVFLLIFFGCFNLFGIKTNLALDQVINTFVAIIAYIFVRKTGYRFFRANYKFFYWFFIILLLITFIIGFEVKGSLRWIDLYFFNLQPSELFKVFYIVFLAEYFSRLKKSANSWKDLIISFLYATL
ncbi:FtsW/RodA/SpoVE family cell cycle protein, partial [Candidatus Roizmanbacteria bacterium]|nr:FtsW/RodA/SpoVE family cell cycle protein [Candidatus Roizmanbacteria bacterium]